MEYLNLPTRFIGTDTYVNLTNTLSSRMPAIIITSLTLTAGLAWNDAIQSVINYYVPEDHKKSMNIWMKLLYVICLTIVIIIIITMLIRIEGDNSTKIDTNQILVK